jgi:hypothetical protein
MIIVVIAFALVFLYRDVHVLVAGDQKMVTARFAPAAILIQLAELGLALALRKWKAGRYRWVGSILPFPVLPVGLFALSSSIRYLLAELSATLVTEIVTGFWLILCRHARCLAKRRRRGIHMSRVR